MTGIELPTFNDKRGTLVVWDRDVPFEVKRVFWIKNVPPGETRANHGHRECEQVIFAVSGSFMVNDWLMTSPSEGVYIPIGTVITLSDFSQGAVALVLCSEHYNESEIFRPAA